MPPLRLQTISISKSKRSQFLTTYFAPLCTYKFKITQVDWSRSRSDVPQLVRKVDQVNSIGEFAERDKGFPREEALEEWNGSVAGTD